MTSQDSPSLLEVLQRVERWLDGVNQFTEAHSPWIWDARDIFKDLRAALVAPPVVAAPAPEYPTVFAYEAACAALEKHRSRADTAELALTRLRQAVQEHVCVLTAELHDAFGEPITDMEQHAKFCADCRWRLREIKALDQILRATPDEKERQ